MESNKTKVLIKPWDTITLKFHQNSFRRPNQTTECRAEQSREVVVVVAAELSNLLAGHFNLMYLITDVKNDIIQGQKSLSKINSIKDTIIN